MTDTGVPVADSVRSRNRILIPATVAIIFSVLHHADHVIRGSHSGWPFQAELTPFTLSLLIYALILPRIYLTARGCSIAGYHLFVAVSGLELISFVHFVPVGGYEAPIGDIYAVYGCPSIVLFALVILAGLIASGALLAPFALKALRTRA